MSDFPTKVSPEHFRYPKVQINDSPVEANELPSRVLIRHMKPETIAQPDENFHIENCCVNEQLIASDQEPSFESDGQLVQYLGQSRMAAVHFLVMLWLARNSSFWVASTLLGKGDLVVITFGIWRLEPFTSCVM